MDDDAPRAKTRLFTPAVLEPLGVADLDAYILVLEDEIARVRAEICRRGSVRHAADAVFGRRG